MPETLTAPALHPHLGDPWVLADLLARPGVVEHGHFRLLSGAHSEHFLRFSQIALDTDALSLVAAALQPSVAAWQPAGVLAPSTAGVSLGGELARRLGLALHLADVDAGGRAVGLLGTVPPVGRPLLLVNDVVTTGEGLRALGAVARAAGAEVCGAAWFASRAEVDVAKKIAAPTAWVVSLDLPAVAPKYCACCATGEPVADALDLN